MGLESKLKFRTSAGAQFLLLTFRGSNDRSLHNISGVRGPKVAQFSFGRRLDPHAGMNS